MKDYNPVDTDGKRTNTVDAAQGDRITVSYDSVHSSERQTFEGEVVDVEAGLVTVDLGEDLRFVSRDGEVSVVTDAAVVRRIGSEAAVEAEAAVAAAVEGEGEAVLVTDGGAEVPETVEVEDPQTGETVEFPTTFARSDLATWFGDVPEEFAVRRVFVYDDVLRGEAVVDGAVVEVGYWPEGGPAGSFFQTDSGFVADVPDGVVEDDLDVDVGRTLWRRDAVDRGEGVETDGGEVVDGDDEVPVAEGDVEAVDETLLLAVLSAPGVLRVVVRDSERESPLVAVLAETSTLYGDVSLSQPVGERVRSSVFALSRGADADLDVEGVRTDARGVIVEFRVREEVVADGGSRPDLGRLSETVEAVRAQLTEDRHATDGHLGTLGFVADALGGERRD